MELVEEPVDELMGVVVFVIVKQGVRCFQCQNELAVVERSFAFLVLGKRFEQQMKLIEHVMFKARVLSCLLLL